jgi:hypothetical protein
MTADVAATVGDIAVNLAASVIAAVSVILAGSIRQRRRTGRLAAFLGVHKSKSVTVVVPSYPATKSRVAVHQLDVSTIIELSNLVRQAGAQVKLDFESRPGELGRESEICVSGPNANSRTAGHLRNFLPGLNFSTRDVGHAVTIQVEQREFTLDKGAVEYVALARLRRPNAPPIFMVGGQTAIANLAGARYLATKTQELIKQYGTDGQFCLILRIVDSQTYGAGLAELVMDCFGPATKPAAGTSQ